jgi:hypothetical protein
LTDDRPDDPGAARAVELGFVCLVVVAAAVVVAAGYWAALQGRLVPWHVVSFGAVAVGAVVYARARGLDTGLVGPSLTDGPVALAAILAPAVVAVLAAVGGAAVGVPLSELTGQVFAPRTTTLTVLSWWAVAAVATGVGYAALASLVVQASIRRVVTEQPVHAVPVAAGIALFFQALLVDAATQSVGVPPIRRSILFLTLAAGFVCIGVTAGFVYTAALSRSLEPLYRPAYVPVFALALVVAAGTVAVLVEVPDVIGHALYGLGFLAAAVGYERTRSVWVPAATLSLFQLSLTLTIWAVS